MADRSVFDKAYDAVSFAHERKTSLCAPFLSVAPVVGVSISVLGGMTAASTVCASDREAARLDELQFDLGEGPCWQALSSRRPVLATDLLGESYPAWPLFADAARHRKVGAMFAFPLAVGTLDVGAVDLYSRSAGTLDETQIADVGALASAAAWQVLRRVLHDHADKEGDADDEDDNPYSRREFHQATGMVLAQLEISATDASLLIRAHAFASGRPVVEVARDIVDRRLVFNPES